MKVNGRPMQFRKHLFLLLFLKLVLIFICSSLNFILLFTVRSMALVMLSPAALCEVRMGSAAPGTRVWHDTG